MADLSLISESVTQQETVWERYASAHAQRRWSVDADVPWTALCFDAMPTGVRQAMADVYGRVLLAEQLGVQVAERLLELVPEGELRDFARAQLADERRHVVFFARVAQRLGASSVPSSSGLSQLTRELAQLHDYLDVLAYAQVLENAGHALFGGSVRESLRRTEQGIRLPGSAAVVALLEAIGHVAKDEALHVAVGMRVLRTRWRGQRARPQRLVSEACGLICAVFEELDPSYRRLGFAAGSVSRQVALAQLKYWRHLEIDPGLEGVLARCP